MNTPAPFTGLIAYPITPIDASGEVDHDTLRVIVGNAAEAGVDAITVLATAGAGVLFAEAERDAIIGSCLEAVGDRVPVYVAVSDPATRRVLRHSDRAARLGASGLVLTPTSYQPLDEAEVIALFATVSEATPLPLCFYNKPVQTQYDLTQEALEALLAGTRLQGVKEPAPRPGRPAERLEKLRAVGNGRVAIGLSGDVPILQDAPAADAWHTALAAILPQDYVQVWRAGRTGNSEPAPVPLLEIARALPTTRALGALHALAALVGFATEPPRSPFLPADAGTVAHLAAAVAGTRHE